MYWNGIKVVEILIQLVTDNLWHHFPSPIRKYEGGIHLPALTQLDIVLRPSHSPLTWTWLSVTATNNSLPIHPKSPTQVSWWFVRRSVSPQMLSMNRIQFVRCKKISFWCGRFDRTLLGHDLEPYRTLCVFTYLDSHLIYRCLPLFQRHSEQPFTPPTHYNL